MSWQVIRSQADVEYLNDLFDNFHDSYLKELCFFSGSYISVDHLMNENNEPIARFLFQRQWENPSVIEIEFKDVIQINVKPECKDEFTYISIARLYLHDNVFFWSAKDYEIHDSEKDSYTWIAAKFVQWREREDLLGNKLKYMQD